VDFTIHYTDAQQQLRSTFSTWLDSVLPPGLADRPADEKESRAKYAQRRELGRRLGERGWLYPGAPREYGGGGLDSGSCLVLQEEMHKRRLRLPPYYDSGGVLGSGTILVWGSDEQKRTLLPPIYKGEVRTWQLLSEPDAGSDLANVKTTAIRDGDEFVLNGQKVYIGSGNGCDRMWVLAVTDPTAKRHHNLGWFMIDADLPGITILPQYLMSRIGEGEGDVGHKNTIYLSDVRVPESCLVGGENMGWHVAGTHLELEHGIFANMNRDRFLADLFRYASEPGASAGALIESEDARALLADLYMWSEINRVLAVRNFWMQHAGIPATYEGSQATYIQKISGLWKTEAVLELLGPYALTDDEDWGALKGLAEEQQREGIVDMHPGGTADIHKVIIARRLGLGRREAEKAGQTH
jgi:alkylation response protein AidB-like acyl-CoA dehydrogenase